MILYDQKRANITLSITGPWSYDLDERSYIKVTVRSANNSLVRDRIILKANIQYALNLKTVKIILPTVITARTIIIL